MDPQEVWSSVLAELQVTLSDVNFATWVKPLILETMVEADGRNLVTLLVPSGFHQQIVEQRYYGQIQSALQELVESPVELVFRVSTRAAPVVFDAPLFATAQNESTGSVPNREKRGFLNPRLTFDTFVVGSSNNFAHAAAQGVISNPGRKYNPLFIYGGVGLGKTHLMHAIGHALLDAYPDYTILYISAETFANELISSLQSKQTSSFKKRYRTCDVLLVDDIQFISGKEYTQEEFFHTFNELYMAERQIILTSDRPPQEIPRIEERLSSRFMGGLTVDIQPPDYEMRVGILQQKIRDFDVSVDPKALELVAERVDSNVRELEGIFRRIAALASAQSRSLDAELVAEFFGVERARKTRSVRPTSIIAQTAKYFDFTSSDLKGQSRKAPLALARHIAMYLVKSELDSPYERIGDLFGGRDHTTVMYGVEKIHRALHNNPQVRDHVSAVKNLLYS